MTDILKSSDGIDFTAAINQHRGGFNDQIDLVFTAVSGDEVTAELEIKPGLLQPYGLVHGGIYCAMVESLCSTGAAIWALPMGLSTVGLDNSTSFVRAVRSGRLFGRALPVHRGRRTQVWKAEIRNDAGQLVADGKVRLMGLEAGAALAGRTVGVESDP